MKVSELIQLINSLIAENKKENNELIRFYQKKLAKIYNEAINKGFEQAT